MSPTFVFLNTLFSQNEGVFFFQHILVLLILLSLITFHSNRKLISQTSYRRVISSVLLILGLELLYLVGLYLNFLGVLPFETFLRSYFQFIFSFSALWFIWLWCFPFASMNSDSPKFVFGMALTLIFFIQLFFTYIVKLINIDIATFVNLIWFLTTLVILVLGFVLLIINHHFNWFFGCIFTLIHLAGMLASQLFPGITQSQSNAILLFSQIIAFTVLPFISQSFIYTALTEEKQVINNLPIASKTMAVLPENVTKKQQFRNSISSIYKENKSKSSNIGTDETNDVKIPRLESELKLVLEDYARIQRLLEEKIQKSKTGRN
jgi:hypothetical protein